MPAVNHERYELRLIYSTTPTGFPTLEHTHAMDIYVKGAPAIGTDFTDIDIQRRNGSLTTLTVIADEYGDLIEPCYTDTASFARWELWHIPANTTNAIFISSLDIGHTGSSVLAPTPAWQSTFSFRSLGGNYGKAQFMEAIFATNSSIVAPYPAPAAALAAYICGLTTPFKAFKDDEHFFSNLHFSNGQNEKLWRKRYRP